MHRHMAIRHLAVVLALVFSLLGAGLLLATPAARADHDTVPWSTIGNVIGFSPTISNANPTMLTDNQGHLYIFYAERDTTLGVANVRVAKFNATGGIIGTPELWFNKQVNDVANVAGPSTYVSAVMDHSGNLYVAWERLSPAPAYEDIYVSSSSDGGNTWLPAVRVGNPIDGTHDVIPTIVTTANGNVYVAWTSYKQGNWFYNISFAMSTNGGNTFINQQKISGQSGGQAIIDSMAIDSEGRTYVAYIGVDPDFNTTQAYHINVTWSDNGLAWTAPTQVTQSVGFHIYPSIAVDPSGRVHLSWLDYRTAFSIGPTAWYSRSDDRGATWTPQHSVGDGSTNPIQFPQLTLHQETVMVLWVGSHRVGGMTHTGMGYSISPDGGTTWYAEKFFDFAFSAQGNLTWLRAAPDSDGTFWAAAETYDNTGSDGDGISLLWWDGPPSSPAIQSATVAGSAATVRWTAPPESDVTGYSVYRSTDGTNWVFLASMGSATTSYIDSNLANGTYWYAVTAIDAQGTASHPSPAAQAQVGPSMQDQIDALQQALDNANSAIATLQSQLNDLRSTLNSVMSQQATQSTALLNTGLEILIIVLLAVILIMQIRKPRNPRPVIMNPQPAIAQPMPPPERLDEEL